MASRNKNIFKRQLISFNPNFRIDTANPQMGATGTDVYKIYGVTDNGDNQSSINLTSGGLFSLYNDRTIEICGGSKNEKGREDVVIIGLNGNVSISAKNGMVRLYATNIMIEADEDIHFKAGRNISMKTGSGRIMMDGIKLDVKGATGNLVNALGSGFTKQVFDGSFVGADILDKVTGGPTSKVVNNLIG